MTLFFGLKMKTQLKNQKPIDSDINFKYKCPKCKDIHWISLQEAQTENFKIVCDCKNVFSVRQIQAVKIKYVDSFCSDIPTDLLDKCKVVLLSYGFESAEAESLIIDSYKESKLTEASDLIKHCLSTFGAKNV